MILRVGISLSAAALLAACAQPQARPVEASKPKPVGPVVTMAEGGAIRVADRIPNEDALAPLHCAAALRARDIGASAIEWAGGVAKPRSGGGFDATMAYETTFDKRLRQPKPGVAPADGGLVAVESWMTYCDEAGMARTGDA